MLSKRWPDASVWGIDSSAAMLTEASAEEGQATHWVLADAAQWRPREPLDLLFSNSLFHLLEHRQMLPELLNCVRPGGQLAIQMPDCFDEPWYRLMLDVLDVLDDGGENSKEIGSADLRAHVAQRLVLSQQDYYDMLADLCSTIDIWDSEYLQVLGGLEPVFEWVSAAGMRPVIAGLEDKLAERFVVEYRKRLAEVYPQREDGRTLFPFRRRFIVARVA
jgi:trans-aconitate 2-methyltransferase